jgi:hypothetical protein
VSVGFGQIMKVLPVIDKRKLEAACDRKKYVNVDAWESRIVSYLTKYLLKGQGLMGCAAVRAGRQSLVYAGGARGKLWSAAVRKAGFAARAWRMGVEWFMELYGHFPQHREWQIAMDYGWECMRTHPPGTPARQEWEFHQAIIDAPF